MGFLHIFFHLCSIITNFLILYYNTAQFRHSILDGLKTTTVGIFEDYLTFLIAILIYIFGYLIFNLIYLSIHYILKLFKNRKNTIKITTVVIVIAIFFYVANDQLIFYFIKDYRWIRHFTANNAEANIDSSNYNEYDWSKKAIEMSIPAQIRDEKLVFNADSTFTLTGRRLILDKFYLFREIFNIEYNFSITQKYECENIKTDYSETDSTLLYCPVEIRNNRLYLNISYY